MKCITIITMFVPEKEKQAMDDEEYPVSHEDQPSDETGQIANMDSIDYITMLMESRII